MAWYNFWKKEKLPDVELYCANTKCMNSRPINSLMPDPLEEMRYRADKQEVYCNAFCVTIEGAYRGEEPVVAFDMSKKISMPEAQKLVRKGKIRTPAPRAA